MSSILKKPHEAELASYRPFPFYFITSTDEEDLCYDAVFSSLKRLKEDGFGGLILFNKPSTSLSYDTDFDSSKESSSGLIKSKSGFSAEEYLSEKWFQMVKNFACASSELGLSLWINDGFNFPPGDAGGRITKEEFPELVQLRLELSDDEVKICEVPWGFPAFEEPKSADLFQKFVYEAYLREVGEHFGKTIKGFFSDADNRRVNYRVFQPDFPVKEYYPWSLGFKESFIKRYDYDITPYLKDILKKKDIPQAADYWRHAGELYQSWFASNYAWCSAHGLKYSFHTSDTAPYPMEQAPRSSAFTEGRAISMEQNCDYPGTDQELLEINGGKHMRKEEYWVPKSTWGGDDSFVRNPEYRNVYSDLRAKQAGSSAFLYHKDGALCEMFAASNWGATPQDLREIATWQIMQGITLIVPHAYHHRLLGEFKYFAPPDFSPHSHLSNAVKNLNDALAHCCYFASQGKLNTKVAVLDITEDVWTRHPDTSKLFKTCAELNRLPYGYVIASVDEILANKGVFSVAINAGKPLSAEKADLLKNEGITVIDADEISLLAQLIPCNIKYTGSGKPHFMCRTLDNGEDLVLLANIEDDKPLTGTLTIGNNEFPVTIYCGEIAVFTKDGQIKYLPDVPIACGAKMALSGDFPVTWENENIVPIEAWINESGKTVTKMAKDKRLEFNFDVADSGVDSLQLLIPKTASCKITSVMLDKQTLLCTGEKLIGDEPYDCFNLSGGLNKGTHSLILEKTGVFADWERFLLVGSFDADVSICNPFYEIVYNQYSLDRHIPEKSTVTLKKRHETLAIGKDWCKEGHPFYSGGVTYHIPTDLSSKFTDCVLKLENVRDMVSVCVDNSAPSTLIYAPFVFDLGDMSGKHTLSITVYNTLANSLECYQAPSGLLGDVIIQAKN